MKHKTARGRVIDMAALSKANETVRAVGNVPMNARGDRLDSSGNVVQTVQAKSRAARDTTQAPEKKKLSDAPGAPKKAEAKKPAAKKKAPVKKSEAAATQTDPDPIIVREEEKTRDDGTRYIEIEYEDGSMDVQEVKE